MKKFIVIAANCLVLIACSDKKTDDGKSSMSSGSDKKPPTEILDSSNSAPVRSIFTSFSKGDLDGMVANMSDSVMYRWSGGDSLVGKQAVKDYYAGRLKLIESINFMNEISLPIQINVSQQPKYAPPGKWVLYWTMTQVKYKNGKELNFWQHSVNHFNDGGKIDFVGMYLDRHPIMEATKDLMGK
jgi:predicted phage tail protein